MRAREKIALSLLTIIVFILLGLQTHLLSSIRGQAWRLWVNTIVRVVNIGPLADSRSNEQLQTLLAENIRLKFEQKDYARLKDQLGEPAFASFRTIPAAVKARPIDTFRSQYIIDRGAQDGVSLDAPVIINGSTLVGFVTDLHEHTATVQLLLNPQTSLSVEVEQEGSPRGLLLGRQFTSLALTTVPRDVTLKPGQAIVSTPRDGMPAGLVIGRIGNVTRQENEPYQEATVRLPYDPDGLRAVMVLVLP